MTQRFHTLILLLLLFIPLAGQAQDQITQADKQAAIDSLSKNLLENYVYPEKAEIMAAAIRKNLKKGLYEGIDNGPAFAERLTKDLQDISHDRHLNLRYAPDRIAEYNASRQGEEDEQAFQMRELQRSRANNFQMKELKMLPGNVGYFRFDGFSGWDEGLKKAMAAMQFLGDADAIIFDIRENGGGDPQMVQVLCSYLFDEVRHLNTFYWRPSDEYNHFYTLPSVEGKRMPDVPVYVLTSGYTFSAAEEFTYNLKNMERATIVGEKTGGGAHPGGTVGLTDKFMVFMPMGKAINPITQTNWEGTGIEPHIAVPASAALEAAHLDALKKIREHKADDQDTQQRLDWVITELNARVNPATIDQTLLQSYAGNYGPRVLVFEGGVLFYQRESGPKRKLLPVSEDTFIPDGVDGFRLKVIREGGKAIAVEGHYIQGRVDRNERDEG